MWYITTGDELKAVADAIRAKGNTVDLLEYPDSFVSAINALPLPPEPIAESVYNSSVYSGNSKTETTELDRSGIYCMILYRVTTVGNNFSLPVLSCCTLAYVNGSWELSDAYGDFDDYCQLSVTNDVLGITFAAGTGQRVYVRLMKLVVMGGAGDGSTEG